MKWTLLCISLCLWAGCKAQPSGQPDDTGQDMTAALTCDNMRCANPDAVCCDGVPCIDTTADPQNCGGCGKACSGQEACRDSRCVCGGGGAQTACTLGTSCCGDGPGYTGGCKDLTLDPANCGACMHACPTSETCSGSACKCGAGPGCTAPKQCCTAGADAGAAAACVDTSQDDNNCGACGHKCSAGHPCKGG